MTQKRLCVLGNSHVASMKEGWTSAVAGWQTLHVDFAGCLKNGMASFGARDDGKMGPLDPEAGPEFCTLSTTQDFIDPEAYDAFLLVGMRFFPACLIRNYPLFAAPGSRNLDIAEQFVSRETLEAALWDELQHGMTLHVARELQRRTEAKIFIAWQPFLSERLTEIEWRRDLYAPILDCKDGRFIRSIMRRVDDRLALEGFGALHQPLDTLRKGVMTGRTWSDGSRLFRNGTAEEHRSLDVFHMNGKFGTRCWSAWLEEGPLPEALGLAT